MESVALRRAEYSPVPEYAHHPVIIIGTGPAGVAVAREILHRYPERPIILYGDEAGTPYNRIQLSSYLAGELSWPALNNALHTPPKSRVELRNRCAVVSINRNKHSITDARGRVQPYSMLVLATGSRPALPDIPGINLGSVYTFRNKQDAQALLKCRQKCRSVIVLGGGLLGLEAARAMQLGHVQVTIIELAPHLMSRQLDPTAGEMLKEYVETLGLRVLVGTRVRELRGKNTVTGVYLDDGQVLPCDMVIVAAGVHPNADLALTAGLAVGRGIQVNEQMQTSDKSIYAVGECAEHERVVEGLVGPCLVQAKTAGQHVVEGDGSYERPVQASYLKVFGRPVVSMGDIGQEINAGVYHSEIYQREREGVYRKLIIRQGRLVGVIALGDWPELARAREVLEKRQRIMPWQLPRFRRTGNLWPPAPEQDVSHWPASATVCHCVGVSHGTLTQSLRDGCETVEHLIERTGASTVCGSCRPLLSQLVQVSPGLTIASEHRRGLLIVSALAAALIFLLLFISPFSISTSVQNSWRIDKLWLDGFWKQFSGYSLLSLVAIALILPLRKRWKRFDFGQLTHWRLAHGIVGSLTLAVLVMHTGLRLGHNFNFLLMATFIGFASCGALAGGAMASARKNGGKTTWLQRAPWTKVHLWMLLPLPMLILFHVISVYYF